jgi:hypothetical protein
LVVGLTYQQSQLELSPLPVVVQGFVRLVLLATCLLQTVQHGYLKLLVAAALMFNHLPLGAHIQNLQVLSL